LRQRSIINESKRIEITCSPSPRTRMSKKVVFENNEKQEESPEKRNIFQIVNGIDAKTGRVRADLKGRKSLYKIDDLKSSTKVTDDENGGK
jgi:hypothetical protein